MRAKFAMIGMINGNQRVDTRFAGRLELRELQLALERGKYSDIDALQAHRRLFQVDEFNAGNYPQNFNGGFDDACHTGMSVKCDPHFDPVLQVRL